MLASPEQVRHLGINEQVDHQNKNLQDCISGAITPQPPAPVNAPPSNDLHGLA
jgi:hypothetical protein